MAQRDPVGLVEALVVGSAAFIALRDDAELSLEASFASCHQQPRVEGLKADGSLVAGGDVDGDAGERPRLFRPLMLELDLQQGAPCDLLEQLPEGLRTVSRGALQQWRLEHEVRGGVADVAQEA